MFEPSGTPTFAGMCAEEWHALLAYGFVDGVMSATFALPAIPDEVKKDKKVYYYRFGFLIGAVGKIAVLAVIYRYAGDIILH